MTTGKACGAIRINRYAEDFTCSAHPGVHIHTRPDGSKIPWGDPKVPYGMRRRRPYTKYANHKLTRQSALSQKRRGLT